ncbi:MAG TPA: methyl-accepting chemotaxis protein [Bacillota bacterium]|nr:methyl-accepting chemotaxis protein [Bacillota bacterium]
MRKLFRSIRVKLIFWFLVVAIIPLVVTMVISYNQSSKELLTKERESIYSIVANKAQGMDDWLKNRMAEIQLAAKTDILQSTDPDRIMPYLHQIKDQSDFYEDVVFASEDGVAIANTNEEAIGANVGEREYFKAGMQGESTYSEVLISKGTGERAIIMASPVIDTNEQKVGVMFASISFEAFVDDLFQDEDSHSGIGTMLVDEQDRLQVTPIEENIGLTVEEADLGEAVINIVAKGKTESGTDTYHLPTGEEYLIAYSPVEETGYGFYQFIAMDQVLASAKSVQKYMVIVMVVASVLVVLLSFYISGTIAKPVMTVTEHVKQVANGDLTHEMLNIKTRDEIGELANNLEVMTNNLRHLIHQVSTASEQVAASSEQLTASAEEASGATEQISASTQQIASGAEQQVVNADNAEEVIHDVSQNVTQISTHIVNVTDVSNDTVETATNGNEVINQSIAQMQQIEETTDETAKAVNELGNKSAEIENIISVITDIAEQTNLLALNAAIEAARAGEHGQGFAVVADEVRKLAEQSAQATDQIYTIIQEVQQVINTSIEGMEEGTNAVRDGTQLTEQAGHAFKMITNAVSNVSDQLQNVSKTTDQLSRDSTQMVKSMESVKSISEDFSSSTQEVAAAGEEQNASMEEIAAASQTLAKMAEDLQKSIGAFKL